MPKDFDPVERTAHISFQIRQALRAALPAPAEQFFTVMVPGKVVNFADYREGFDNEGKLIDPILPTVTELNQAILCDDMPCLAPVQLGPTGKSVARSYDAAISKLVPAGTTVGVDNRDGTNLTEEEARYRRAMDWLTFRDRDQGGEKSRIEVYAEKQAKYTKAVEAKTKAFDEALQRSKNDPNNVTRADQRASYDRWVADNARTYRNFIQAAYMDWIVTGNKEEVEYWFSIVDRGSAMARVEASKEAMRAAVVQDSDGSVEYQKVRLTPPNWALIAEKKAQGDNNQTRTVEWYSWEIARLVKLNSLLKALKDRKAGPPVPKPGKDDDAALVTCMSNYITKRAAWQASLTDKKLTPEQKTAAETEYNAARDALKTEEEKHNQGSLEKITNLSQAAQDDLYNSLSGDNGLAAGMITANENKINEYTKARDALLGKSQTTAETFVDGIANGAGVPKAQKDPLAGNSKKDVDYFTPITIEISSTNSSKSKQASKTAASFGASVGWGWWSAGVSSQYNEESAKISEAMSKNDCKISFECMRVDIHRPWLRAELFYDSDLTTGPDEFISPGFSRLRDLMERDAKDQNDQKELDRYSTLPLYPTAFLLAANVVLEISGDTTAIQSHFNQSSYKASSTVNYGPFSIVRVSGNYSKETQSSGATCDVTSDGCRITIKSPQIIGWISQMVPALPRLKDDAPQKA